MRALGRAAAAALAVGWISVAFARTDPEPKPPPAEGGSPFPTPERLEDLTETPLPEGTFDRALADVESWVLEGPFPNVLAAVPYREPSDWGGLLESQAARRAGLVVPTEAMHCAAREWGRFLLANGAPPGPGLTTWIGARCSASTPQISYHHFDGGIPAGASEAEVFEGWRAAVESMLEEHLVGGPLAAGIWYGQKDGRAIAVVAVGERLAHVRPLPVVLEGDGHFVLEGELLVESGDVSATVNQGRFGVSDCERADLRLPRFAFRCQTDPEDRDSWLTVTTTPPGRLIGRAAVGVALFPSGEPHGEWRRPKLFDPVLVGPETDVKTEIAGIVNRVRGQAGLEPIELSDTQSLVADRLAPYYFASAFGVGPAEAGDLVVMGLIAGWNVEGIVQSGSFASSFVLKSLDLDRLVATAVAYPAGRRALLSADARRLAVGTVVRDDAPFLASVFGTYAVFEGASHDEAARRVLEALDAARAERGKPRAKLLLEVAPLGRLAAARVQGGEAPPDVLNDLLRQSSQVLGRSVNGWFVDARDLERIGFPESLLERDVVEVAVGVSHHKPAGQAWGSWVVLIVAAGPEGRGA
ncbi:MAG TPA: hypothetical protein VKB65_06245 [Myxococcota bacterium]|nr:hypothetical protein [Myxococcota bacterium]